MSLEATEAELTHDVEHDVHLLDLLRKQSEVALERADDSLHAERLELLRLVCIPHDGSDFERARARVSEETSEDGPSKVT